MVNHDDLELLKSRVDRTVQFHCKDGEIFVGTVQFVSDEEQDVIYDVITSNRMARYQQFGESVWRVLFDEIDFVTSPES